MFDSVETIHLKSDEPRAAIAAKVRDALERIDHATLLDDHTIRLDARRHASFAFEVAVEVAVGESGDRNRVPLTVSYRLKPTPRGLALGIIFFVPAGVIFLMQGLGAKNDIQDAVVQKLRALDHNAASPAARPTKRKREL